MRFEPIAAYNDENKVDPKYAPFPDTNIVCTLKPKAKCSRPDPYAIEFLLEEDT